MQGVVTVVFIGGGDFLGKKKKDLVLKKFAGNTEQLRAGLEGVADTCTEGLVARAECHVPE